MKKTLLIIIFSIAIMISLENNVYGEDEKQILLDEYAETFGEVFEEGQNVFLNLVPDFSMTEMLKSLNKGELSISPVDILKGLWKLILGEVYSGTKLMTIVLVMSV